MICLYSLVWFFRIVQNPYNFMHIKGTYSPQFIEALEAKGIDASQFLAMAVRALESEFALTGNLNTSQSLSDDLTFSVDLDLRYAPVSEVELSRRTGVSRHTLRSWRRRGGDLDGTFETRGRNIFYYLVPALKSIKLKLYGSRRGELLSREIFKLVKNFRAA